MDFTKLILATSYIRSLLYQARDEQKEANCGWEYYYATISRYSVWFSLVLTYLFQISILLYIIANVVKQGLLISQL